MTEDERRGRTLIITLGYGVDKFWSELKLAPLEAIEHAERILLEPDPPGDTPREDQIFLWEVGMKSIRREKLGRMVREVWLGWAREQPNPKPSWLLPWEQLEDPEREVDRRIGDRIAEYAKTLPQITKYR